MCGFFAFLNPKGATIDLEACRKAVSLQTHRGPDASGEWVSPCNGIFLGHRRLSIIDLSDKANQPMVHERGDVLVYNGEIYNYRNLRTRLEQKGRRFVSSSDTEVLLHALDSWGADCLTMLEGMFAFLLWNPEQEEALIARDFFGIKPLYYWKPPTGGLVVSSEIKSITALPSFSPDLNQQALSEYLRFRSLAGGETLLHGVRQVLPGQWVRYDRAADEITFRTYWDPAQHLRERYGSQPDSLTESDFLSNFSQTVERHLIADVPVGTQFSGGIDSSLISAIVSNGTGRSLSGFYCRVESADFDETSYAESIAQELGMPLHQAQLHGNLFLSDLLERLTWHHDEPLTHPNSMGIYLVSERAREHVKVLLSGECADEFFGGYGHYPLVFLMGKLGERFGARSALKLMTRLVPRVGPRMTRLAERIAGAAEMSLDETIVTAAEWMDKSRIAELLADSRAPEQSLKSRLAMLDRDDSLDAVTRAQIFDVRTYVPALLLRQDKMSMAASIENRVPFATPETFALALSVPTTERAGLVRRKSFLKSCLKRYLPSQYVNRRKWGFGLPLAKWLSTPSGIERIHELASPNSPLLRTVDQKAVRRLVNDFQSSDGSTAGILWTLLSLNIWMQQFCTGAAGNQPVSQKPSVP